jgi:hypothetical protein
VRAIVRQVGGAVVSQPAAFGNLLCVLDVMAAPQLELAVVGDSDDEGTRRLLEVIHSRFLPGLVLALGEPGGDSDGLPPLLRGRAAVEGKATAYVCTDSTCQAPVTVAAALAALLPRS